jgi:dUTPase
MIIFIGKGMVYFMQLQIKRLDPMAHMPTRATDGSAGMDLRA